MENYTAAVLMERDFLTERREVRFKRVCIGLVNLIDQSCWLTRDWWVEMTRNFGVGPNDWSIWFCFESVRMSQQNHQGVTEDVMNESPFQDRQLRNPSQRPIIKLSVDLIATYKSINEVCYLNLFTIEIL
jgi:hypothetical protein